MEITKKLTPRESALIYEALVTLRIDNKNSIELYKTINMEKQAERLSKEIEEITQLMEKF